MDRDGIRAAARRDRKGKRAGRHARGVRLKERDGYWHAHGTLRAGGCSIRVRRSLGLAVTTVSQAAAEAELEAFLDELKARATGKVGRGDPVAIAAHHYLNFTRERPLAPSAVRIVKEAVTRFGTRRLNEIGRDWKAWIDGEHGNAGFVPGRMTGRSASTRERFLNGVLALLSFAKRHHGLADLPLFERDKKARNPNRRARRRVADLRPDLIRILFDSAHVALRAQLSVEKVTGARVSSVLYGVRLCDLIMATGREQIIFRATKNGEDVCAALDGSTVAVLKEYLKWRGRLHDREAPLFLTPRRKPYKFNNRDGGGQNKTAFNGAKRRAQKAILAAGEAQASRLRRIGDRKGAEAARQRAASDADLLGKVTQHWFRHLFATRMLRLDPRAAMEQGGWLDIRSLMGYAQDVPEHRRKLVAGLDDLAAAPAKRARS
jgi:hypothetical protein